MKAKRIIIATLSGLLFGIVCYSFAASGEDPVPWAVSLNILTSRLIMGFAIGISSLKMNWAVHGLLLGLIFSLPLGIGATMAGTPEFTAMEMFISTVVMGMIYGLLIEVITSLIFKARVK